MYLLKSVYLLEFIVVSIFIEVECIYSNCIYTCIYWKYLYSVLFHFIYLFIFIDIGSNFSFIQYMYYKIY